MIPSPRLGSRALACILGAALITVPCTPLLAQDKPAKGADKTSDKKADAGAAKKPSKAEAGHARTAFADGERKLKKEDYAGALESYRKANDIIPAAAAQYRIGFCLDKLGKKSEALAAYNTFLAFPPPDKMSEQKTLAETRVAELSTGTLKVSSTPTGATVTIDGQPAGNPTPLSVPVKSGTHKLEVSQAGYDTATQSVEVAPGATQEVNVPLQQTPPPPPPPPVAVAPPPPAAPPAPPPAPPAPPRSNVPAYVTLGLGGVGAVVGTIFGVKALSSKSDFKNNPTVDNADATDRNALIADMAFGVAITLGITGTVLLLSSDKPADSAKAARLRILPVVTPQTQGAAAVLRF